MNPMSHPSQTRYFYHLTSLLKRLGLVVVFYGLIRLLFLIRNADYFTGITHSIEIPRAFLLGLRFDTSAILVISSPFIMLSILPAPWLSHRYYQAILKWVFWTAHLPFLILSVIDIEFYRYTDRRSTTELLSLMPEIREQASHLVLDYWWLTLVGLALIYGLTRVYPKAHHGHYQPVSVSWKQVPIPFLCIALTVLGIRGTLQVRPLSAGHAFEFSAPILGNLALNTPFVFITSIDGVQGKRVARKLSYYQDLQAVLQELPEAPQYGLPPRKLSNAEAPDNLLLIVVESLNSELVGFENKPGAESSTPFLDQLAKQGSPFTNHFANSKRSIAALPAILLSFPNWLNGAFSTSPYQGNRFGGLGSALRNHGYSTWFFHGTRPGTMTFDIVSKVAGFEHYYSIREYGHYPAADHDGHWGIYDEPMIDRVGAVLGKEKGPFAGVLFTLSTHQPQIVDPRYRSQFGEKGPGPTIRYFDHSLESFFQKYQNEPWFKKTLFVITGDHTHDLRTRAYQTPLGRYDVPLLFYHPSKKLPAADLGKVANQLDITPSILDLLGIQDQKLNRFGFSVFGHHPGQALLNVANVPSLVTAEGMLTMNEQRPPVFYRYEDRVGSQILPVTGSLNESARALQKKLSAYLQYFHNGLLENAWISVGK
jgi:uncharacterized sulfatase